MRKYYIQSRRKRTSYIHKNETRLTVLDTPCVGTVLQNIREEDTSERKTRKKT
jgi:hypothetical protein